MDVTLPDGRAGQPVTTCSGWLRWLCRSPVDLRDVIGVCVRDAFGGRFAPMNTFTATFGPYAFTG